MAEILAIEWDPKCLRGIDAVVTGDSIQIRHIFEMPQPSGQEQPELREWFAHLLAEKAITTKQVVVMLPRESVVVRRLELPDAPDDELPMMVRFQAASKSSLNLDDVALDFTTLPRREGVASRDVISSMVQTSVIQAIRQFVEGAQRELFEIGLSPFATAKLASRIDGYSRTDPQSATLLVTRSVDRVEITVAWMGQVIFSHSARLDVEKPDQQIAVILTEISRAWMSFQNLNLPVKLTDGLLFGTEQDSRGLADALQARLKFKVRLINPFDALKVNKSGTTSFEQASSYAALLGCVLPNNQSLIQTMNFLSPRKPVVKPDTTRLRQRQLAIGGGIVAALLLLCYWIGLMSLDSTISQTGDTIAELDSSIKKGAALLASTKEVDGWVQDDLNLLDELGRFQDQLPSTDRIYVTKYSINVPSNKNPGEIRVEGHAREEKDIRQLREKLIAPETGYKTSAEEIKSENKEYYPKKLTEQIKVGKPASAKKSATTSIKPNEVLPAKPGVTKSTSPPIVGTPQK